MDLYRPQNMIPEDIKNATENVNNICELLSQLLNAENVKKLWVPLIGITKMFVILIDIKT